MRCNAITQIECRKNVIVRKRAEQHASSGRSSTMGVLLGEVAVGKVVLLKEFNILEDRAVIKRVTGGVTRQTGLSGVKWLSSAKGVDVFVHQISAVFKAIWNGDQTRIINTVVCIGNLDVIEFANDNICCFGRRGCGTAIARAQQMAIARPRTTLQGVWLLWLWQRSVHQWR